MLFFMFLASLPLGEKDCWAAADRAAARACCARGTGPSAGCLPDGFAFAECCPLGDRLPEDPDCWSAPYLPELCCAEGVGSSCASLLI